MSLNSRVLAFILAFTLSIITSLCLYLIKYFSVQESLWIGLVSFLVSGFIIYAALEFLFFRELKGLYQLFSKIEQEEIFNTKEQRKLKSFTKIYSELYKYAENKQTEIEELKRMAKFRRQFLADVSHELKTPIFAAQGFVHTLLDGAVNDVEIRMKFLKKAARSLDGLDILVQDLLTVSHMEAGDITMQKENFDIGEMIYDVFDQFEETTKKAGIKLFASCKRFEEIIVHADPRRIYQVLVNLISNAVKYSNGKGKVYVSVDEDTKEKVRVSVADDGVGIASEHLNRIFERFYRVDKSRSKERGGTGLGLAIVKHIVEAHKSEIHVKSKVGKGTDFSFELNTKS
jgi:two-component system phosphate regulon sensor histidine kinase PhoR